MSIYNKNLVFFIILMLVGIIISILVKNENMYDLANYHYYNAWAFLNDRSNLDIVPGCVNTFFNPIVELPIYFLINYFNDSQNIFYAFQGIWFGLFLFILSKIGFLFFGSERKGQIKTMFVLILATTGNAVFCQIGSSTNEITVAFFILWGFYILLKMIKFPETQTLKKFLLAGLIMGIGLGLKQTVVTYCVASGITLMICYKYLNKPFKSILCFALGGLIGYLIINGYFMYKYWILYQNPFFPFLNGIFKSPYFEPINYRDDRWVSEFPTVFIYPFLWNIKPKLIAEGAYFDIRLTLIYAALIIVSVLLFTRRNIKVFYQENHILFASTTFCFLSLLIWMFILLYMRYAIVIESLGALLFVKLFDLYDKNKHFRTYLCHLLLGFGLSVSVLFYPSWGNMRNSSKHIEIQKITLPDNTLIKIYGIPSSFIIPEITKMGSNIKTTTYYPKCKKCLHGTGGDFAEYGKFKEKRDKMEKEHSGPVIYVYVDDFNPFLKKEKIQEDYLRQVQLCRRAAKLKFIKNSFDCLKEKREKYINDLALAEEYGLDDGDYYCQELHDNLRNDLNICVPEELKTQILGEEND